MQCFALRFLNYLYTSADECNKTDFNYTIIYAYFLEDKAALNKVKQSTPLAIPPTQVVDIFL